MSDHGGVTREFVTLPDGTVEERHTFSPEAWARLTAALAVPPRCEVWEDNVRGDVGGPCRKALGHDGEHDPFERIIPDSLRETFGLPPVDDRTPLAADPEPLASLAREYLDAEDAIGFVDARRLAPLADALRRRDRARAALRAALEEIA